jgi:hypothetical protein
MPATDESRRCDITARDHCSLFEEDLRQAIKKLSTMLPDQVTVRLDEFADFSSVLPAVQAEYDLLGTLNCVSPNAGICPFCQTAFYWQGISQLGRMPHARHLTGGCLTFRGDVRQRANRSHLIGNRRFRQATNSG